QGWAATDETSREGVRADDDTEAQNRRQSTNPDRRIADREPDAKDDVIQRHVGVERRYDTPEVAERKRGICVAEEFVVPKALGIEAEEVERSRYDEGREEPCMRWRFRGCLVDRQIPVVIGRLGGLHA